jgi:hypothetical protein
VYLGSVAGRFGLQRASPKVEKHGDFLAVIVGQKLATSKDRKRAVT